MDDYTFSFFARVPRIPEERWWHRLLRVSPRPVQMWERRHFTTRFPNVEEAKAFASVLMRPEVLPGIAATGDAKMWQLEEHNTPTNYITTHSAGIAGSPDST